MSKINQLIKELENNLKADCCTSKLIVNGGELKIKLYDTIADACEENKNFKWYFFEEIVPLNSKVQRTKGIVCHKCENDKCIISLIIDKSENTRFCVAENIEIRLTK
jgi:hypothetical protein